MKVAVNKTIRVTFSEPVKMGRGSIKLNDSAGRSVSFIKFINGSVLTIKPIGNLTQGIMYTLRLYTGSVTDLSGNKYVFAGCTNFTTYSNYLIPTSKCQVTNSKIKALVTKITRGKATRYAKANAIFKWVRDKLSYSYYYNTQYGAVGTLFKRTGNCCDTSHLLVALERAAGIPARYEHVKAKFRSGHWYGHVLAQVYIKGKWHNADATSFRNSFGVIKNWNTATATYYGTYAILPF
ncbi:MAG TPA: transglutaminase family protein [Methanobacterium sp.]|nr:transglutaminase family protein [Methanobacterium sp.]